MSQNLLLWYVNIISVALNFPEQQSALPLILVGMEKPEEINIAPHGVCVSYIRSDTNTKYSKFWYKSEITTAHQLCDGASHHEGSDPNLRNYSVLPLSWLLAAVCVV